MVRDGYFYGGGMLAAAAVIAWLAGWPYAIPVLLLGAFFLWFFRDPERQVPATAGAIVSPADGKVTAIAVSEIDGVRRTRLRDPLADAPLARGKGWLMSGRRSKLEARSPHG